MLPSFRAPIFILTLAACLGAWHPARSSLLGHGVEIDLTATVTSLTNGSFTDDAVTRSFTASQLPNFPWSVGQQWQLSWSLSAQEISALALAAIPPAHCANYPVFHFFGGVHVGFPATTASCDGKQADSIPWLDACDIGCPNFGPTVDLLTGQVTPFYQATYAQWLTGFFTPNGNSPGYTYHPSTNTYTNDGPLKFPQFSELLANFHGTIGPSTGQFLYSFPVVLPNDCDFCGGIGEEQINFAADWQVIITPEPSSVSLFGIGLAWIVIRNRQRARSPMLPVTARRPAWRRNT